MDRRRRSVLEPGLDIVSPVERSRMMASVRQKDTSLERAVRSALWHQGLRYRINQRNLPGSPDIVLSASRVAIQARGCFWHGHLCRRGRRPSSRPEYWLPKILQNQRRDRRQDRQLRALGWCVITVWQCSMSTKVQAERTIRRIVRKIHVRRQGAARHVLARRL